MTDPTAQSTRNRRQQLRLAGAVACSGLLLGLATLGVCAWNRTSAPEGTPADKDQPVPSVGNIPLFSQWPKAKPDAAIILSGQTFGFLQPCGCSRPQYGGLERRAVFINSLRAKGWTVAGFDLGDLYASRYEIGPGQIQTPTEQALLKYKTAMNAMREMGYVAIGLGKNEFAAGVDSVLAEYALQKEQPPFTLAGNLMGSAENKPIPRELRFPPIDEKSQRAMVGLAEIADVGGVPVGVVGVVGKSLAAEVSKLNPGLAFEDNREVLKRAADALTARKTAFNVLLFQGTSDEAKKVAEDWPQFQVILCQADDPEPPQYPEFIGGAKHPAGQKTMLIQVGHKGRYVGVLGAFKRSNGGYELKYQLVPLSEEYLTPGTEAEASKVNRTLPLLETYAELVRDRKYLGKVPQAPHAYQIQQPKMNLSFIGSERCQNCHAAEATKWKETPHSHALEALEKKALRPSQRNFDAECVVCHTVGFGYKTGFEDAEKTPHLKHVGCESCHGPGSGHAGNPKDKSLLSLQSPWKVKADDRLPDPAFMKKMAELNGIERGKVPMEPAQQRLINAVSAMCMKCHDHDNDPNFDLYKYWPKVNHTFGKPGK